MQQAPPPQAPAELAARPAPSGGSHLDHPGPADAYRDLRALSCLSRRPPYLGASAASGARTPAASTWRPSCPEELMAGIFLGHELLRGDLKPRLLKPGTVGRGVGLAPPHRGRPAQPVVLGGGQRAVPGDHQEPPRGAQ